MTLEYLKQIVEKELDIPSLSDRHSYQYLVRARALFWYFAVRRFGYSMNESAKMLGFTHANAMSQLNKHELRLDEDNVYATYYEKLASRLFDERVNPKFLIPNRIYRKLSLLSEEELKDFEENKLNPYLKVRKII